MTYGDFGRGELVASDSNRLWLSALYDALLGDATITEAGSNEFHQHPFDFRRFVLERGLVPQTDARRPSQGQTPLSDAEFFRQAKIWWDELMKVMWEDRVFMRAPATKRPRPFTFAVLHGDAAEQLWQLEREARDGRNRLQPLTFFARALSVAHTVARKLASQGHSYERTAAYVLRSQLELLADDLRYVPGAIQVVSGRLDRVSAESKDPEQLFPLFRAYVEFGYLLRGLDAVGITIKPRVFAGEDFDNSKGRAFAKFVGETSIRVCERRRQEGYDATAFDAPNP